MDQILCDHLFGPPISGNDWVFTRKRFLLLLWNDDGKFSQSSCQAPQQQSCVPDANKKKFFSSVIYDCKTFYTTCLNWRNPLNTKGSVWSRWKVDEKSLKTLTFLLATQFFFVAKNLKKNEMHIVWSMRTIYRLLWFNQILWTTNNCLISHISMNVNLQTNNEILQ